MVTQYPKHLRLLIVLRKHCYEDLQRHLANQKHINRYTNLCKRIDRLIWKRFKNSEIKHSQYQLNDRQQRISFES